MEKLKFGYFGIYSNYAEDGHFKKTSDNIEQLFKKYLVVDLVLTESFRKECKDTKICSLLDKSNKKITREEFTEILDSVKNEAKRQKIDHFFIGYSEENVNTTVHGLADYKIQIFHSYISETFISVAFDLSNLKISRNAFIKKLEDNSSKMFHTMSNFSDKYHIVKDDPNKTKNDLPADLRYSEPNAPMTRKNVLPVKKIKVVILDLKSFNIPEIVAKDFNDSLLNQFKRSELYTPVNRKNLDSLLGADDYKKIGKLSGAEKIVAGSIGKLGDIYSITLKMIDVKTGENENILNYREKGYVEDLFHFIKNYHSKLKKKQPTAPPQSFSAMQKTKLNYFEQIKLESPEYILGRIDLASYINEPNRFTYPETNLFLNKPAADIYINVYDIIDITKGLDYYKSFYKPVTDSSGINSIILKSVKYTSDRNLNKNSALEINTDSSGVSLDLGDSVKFSRTISIATNIKFDKFPEKSPYPFIYKGNGQESMFSLYIFPDGRLEFKAYSKTKIDSVSYKYLKLNKWYHIVAQIDRFSGELTLYLNNKMVAAGTAAHEESVITEGPLNIGYALNNSQKSACYFKIDDIRIYDRILNNSEVHCLYYEKDWPSKALVLFQSFNGTGYEATRKTNNYTFANKDNFTTDRFGKKKNAYKFDSFESRLDLTCFYDFELYFKFSIALWLKVSDKCLNETPVIIDKYYSPSNNGFRLSLIKEENEYRIQFIHNGKTVKSKNTIKKSKWYNLALIYDKGKIVLFINGEKDSEHGTNCLFTPHNDLFFMLANKNKPDKDHSFLGVLDDIRIYYRTLCDEEIKLLYHENGWK